MQLTPAKQQKIRELAQKYSLGLLLLFGSRLTGKTHKESDYDVGYLRHAELTIAELSRFQSALARIFGVPAEKIDIVYLAHARPLLLFSAAINGKLLYGRSGDFRMLRLYALKTRQDNRKFFQLTQRYIEKAVAPQKHG